MGVAFWVGGNLWKVARVIDKGLGVDGPANPTEKRYAYGTPHIRRSPLHRQ